MDEALTVIEEEDREIIPPKRGRKKDLSLLTEAANEALKLNEPIEVRQVKAGGFAERGPIPKKRGRKPKSSAAEIGEQLVKEREAKANKKVKPNEIARRVKANKTAQGKAHLTKAVKVIAKGKASTVSTRKVMGALTMKRSYQKEGKIATGTAIAGGARQTVCTFPEKLFGRIGARAKKEGTSFAEQIRRLTTQALGAK